MTHHRHHPIKPHHRTHTYPAYVTDFIKALVPIAQGVKKTWGTPVAVLVAQGALESSWGQHSRGTPTSASRDGPHPASPSVSAHMRK